MEGFPKISIVTPSFNQGNFIEQTITSILNQNYPNLEYIIIDGGSTDNSVDIIKKYEHHLKYWVSENDSGQANAINKGLQYCTGDIFNWINSDDYLEPFALYKIADAFENQTVHMIAGKVCKFLETKEEVVQNKNLTAKGLMCWEKGVQFVQPGVWLRRELVKACGGIDEKFHYAFDWDLYIRYLYHFPMVKEITALLVHFRLHDDSKTQSVIFRFAEEERRIIEKLYHLNDYSGLKEACLYKIQKTMWTSFLSELSKADSSILTKFLAVLKNMSNHNRVCLTRQTLGALKAFLLRKSI